MKTQINKKNRNLILLIIILALAFILRIYKLGINPYTAQELERITFTVLPFPEMFKINHLSFMHSPVYLIILCGWAKMFQFNEFFTKLLSVLIGTSAILPLYFLILRLKDGKTALIAAYFAAVSPFYITHSRIISGEALSLLLISLSILMFIKLCEDKNNTANAVIYSIITIMMIYSTPVGILTLLCQWCWLGLRWQSTKQKLKLWIITQVCIVLAYIYQVVMFVKNIHNYSPASGYGLFHRFLYTFHSFVLGQANYPLHWKTLVPAVIVSLLVVAFGIKSLKGKRRTIVFLAPLFFIHLLPLFSSSGVPEYCIGASIACLILVSIGIMEMRFHSAIMAMCLLSYFNAIGIYNLLTQ